MSHTEAYIRDYYGVPARVGGRITFGWQGPRVGTIVGFAEGRLLVRFDGEDKTIDPSPLHPTWEVQYHDPEPTFVGEHGPELQDLAPGTTIHPQPEATDG